MSLTPEQHKARASGVGASEVYDALFNPTALWLRKTGREAPEDDSALFRLGHAIQPYIISECATERGVIDVRHEPDTMRSGRMVAHLDASGRMADKAIALEAKWRGSRDGFGEPGTAEIPRAILLQVMAQMRVAALELALVPVLFLRPPVVTYDVPYDVQLGDLIEQGVNRFWWHVEHDKAPTLDPERREALAILRKLYPGTNGQRMQAPAELEHWYQVHRLATEESATYHATADKAKAHLLAAMGEYAEMEFVDGYLLRRKQVNRKGYTVEPTTFIDSRFVKAKGD